MSKKSYNLFLGLLIPIYCLVFILFAYTYSQSNNNLDENTLIKNNTSDDLNSVATNTKDILDQKILNETSSNTIIPADSADSEINPKSVNISTSSVYIKKFEYIKIVNSCDINYEGECLNVRSGPGINFSVVAKLRDDMILKTDSHAIGYDGKIWYHVSFDEWLRFPERVKDDWFVSSDFVKETYANVEKITDNKNFNQSYKDTKNKKSILINLKDQKLYAYENIDGENKLFLETFISAGLDDTPTPIGTFQIFYKTPSRYMQGPIDGVSDQYYDLPGVPWTMYFTAGGAAIHGAYWHDNFGNKWSHGCINLYPYDAETLYKWADLGTSVEIIN